MEKLFDMFFQSGNPSGGHEVEGDDDDDENSLFSNDSTQDLYGESNDVGTSDNSDITSDESRKTLRIKKSSWNQKYYKQLNPPNSLITQKIQIKRRPYQATSIETMPWKQFAHEILERRTAHCYKLLLKGHHLGIIWKTDHARRVFVGAFDHSHFTILPAEMCGMIEIGDELISISKIILHTLDDVQFKHLLSQLDLFCLVSKINN
jgi:hypothetical protein